MQVLFVIAPENFRDEEYKIPETILSKKGILVLTASTTTKNVTGMLGMVVKPDLQLESAKEISFDALFLVGGSGAKVLWDNEYLHNLVRDFYKKKKLIGAICLAPVILARAGILRGKKATVYESAIKELKDKDAFYSKNSIEQDGLILTGNGPAVANLFGQTFAKILLNGI